MGHASTREVDAGRTAEHFLVAVLGGLILGVAVGVVGSTVLQRIDEALLETTVTLILAYGGYILASALGSSGPLETVAAGLFLGAAARRSCRRRRACRPGRPGSSSTGGEYQHGRW